MYLIVNRWLLICETQVKIMKKQVIKLIITFLVYTVFVLSFTSCDSSSNAFSHEHKYTDTITEATCTQQGFITHTCNCGDSYTDSYTEALRHNYTDTITEATCTQQGFITHTCKCGDSYIDSYTEVLGHKYEKNGITTYKCTRCDNYNVVAHTTKISESNETLLAHIEEFIISLSSENQLSIANIVDTTKKLINTSFNENEIDNEIKKSKYKIDLIILLDKHQKILSTIESQYDYEIKKQERLLAEYSLQDMFYGDTTAYNRLIDSYRERMQKASIQYDKDLKYYNQTYASNKYNNTMAEINREKKETERLWNNKMKFENAKKSIAQLIFGKETEIEKENASYNSIKAEIEAKIVKLQLTTS